MSNVPQFEAIAETLSLTPTERYVHPAVEESNSLVQRDAVMAKPPAHQLFWRLNRVRILHNFDGLFDRKNEVALVAITIDSNAADPIQFSPPAPFVGIRKDDLLPIGDAGLGMYFSKPERYPSYLGLNLLIIEDDKAIRDMGASIQRVRNSPEYKAILTTSQTLASSANPAYGALITLSDALVGLTAKMMTRNKDDLLAYFAATYTRAFDDLGIGKHTFHQDERAHVQYEILARN